MSGTELELSDYIDAEEGRDSEPEETFFCACKCTRPEKGAKSCETCSNLVCAEECQELLKCEGADCNVVLCHDHVTWLEGSLTFCAKHAAEHVAEMADMDQVFPGWRVHKCTACGDPTAGVERLCRECSGINAVLESLDSLQGEVR